MYACAYRTDENSTGNSEAHWALLFQYEVEACVRVEMAQGYGANGREGKIHLSNVKPFDASPASNWGGHIVQLFYTRNFPSVQDFIDVIVNEGRERYTFTEEGEGSRFWAATVIKDFTKAKLLPKDSGEEIMKAISFDWSGPNIYDPRPVREGTFG
ncbi:hypothetical protein T310_1159 [Rasamsonia emersonii CBS 393.64]|uniref:DUF7770 domain-containing protein n=1 Tax=Rasamsonia emersonii (strain ATCC 16479 / CBS 393.64 / IMI 116815) TaxID=1408163 RepID=A0A0F4Z387_RASE3|nr:hypothetical protein T310_1159 [Rasamsonia emersonii CBS 393.64]KKA24800.1 hypothetical protein T310_1159 [Rasamsonia emersonii CBS 393.64]